MNYVSIKKIKLNPANPRIIKDDKYRKLVKSIGEFPKMLEKRPIVCYTDKEGNLIVLGGNMRLKAAIEVGMKEVPVSLADDWTEQERNEFLIKDNVSFGEWDWDSLANEWDDTQLVDWGIDLPINNYFEIEDTETEQSESLMPRGTDDEYSTFELIMLHENKLILLDTLNQVKRNFLFEKSEEALMEIIRKYNNL